MFKKLEGARLGLFVFIGTVLLVLSIFMIGNRESLFVQTISVKTYFPKIEGLKTGAPVRLSGYDIGSVSGIVLAGDTLGRVEVTMNINNEVKRYIRLDSYAAIETEGLVGKKIISITTGSPGYAEIEDGGFIESKSPINITEIFEESVEVIANLNTITRDLSEVFAKVNQGEGTIGKLINDDALYESTVQITKSADKSLNAITSQIDNVAELVIDVSGRLDNIMRNVDSTIVDARKILQNVNEGKGVLGALAADENMYDSLKTVISNLVITTEQTLDGARGFAENMEALKHNWLFKTYFEQRGYWDKNDYENELQQKIDELDKKLQEYKDFEEKYGELRKNQ